MSKEVGCITPYAEELVRKKSFLLKGRFGYLKSDIDDIQQELFVEIIENHEHYDPEKGSYKTWLNIVVNRKIWRMIRQRQLQKSDFRRKPVSLDNGEEESAWHKDEVLEDIDPSCAFNSSKQHEKMPVDERVHLQQAIASLPEDLKEVLDLVSRMTNLEAARQLGISKFLLKKKLGLIDRHLRDYGIG